MTVPIRGPNMNAKVALAPTGDVLNAHNLSRANPRWPGNRLTERQQLALALRESEQLAAAIEYHDEVSDSHSSDAESEDAFSSVFGKQHQTPSLAGICRRDCSQTAQQRARAHSRRCGAHSPVKSDLVDSLDSTAMNLPPANTPSTSDICSPLDEQSRQQPSSGAIPHPLSAASVSQTDRDSDMEDGVSHQHLLNHRLWSSNSDDSMTAAVSIPADNDTSSCGKCRPPSSLIALSSKCSNATSGSQQSILPCTRDQDDVCTAMASPKKRHRASKDSTDSQTAEAADVDPDVIQRRRRRQEKLGGCMAASRHLPAASIAKSLALPPQQQPHPLPLMRQASTRPAVHTVVLQESDPFADAAAGDAQQASPLRGRIRIPCKMPLAPSRIRVPDSLHQRPSQPASQHAIISPKAFWSPDLSPHNRCDASATVDAAPAPSHPPMPAVDIPYVDVTCAPLTAQLQATPRSQPPCLPAAGQHPGRTTSNSGAFSSPKACNPATVAAPLLPFGSPAVVRQFDASFFPSPRAEGKSSAADAATPSVVKPSDTTTTVEAVTATPLAVTTSAVTSFAVTAATPTASLPSDAIITIKTATSNLQIVTPSSTEACSDSQPASPAFKTPPVQRKRLKLLPPRSETSLDSGGWIPGMSVGPPPAFLERQSPFDPPVVVARARRSRVNLPRSSSHVWADIQTAANGCSSPLTPCISSGGCTRRLRSTGGASSSSIFGSASSASLLSLEDMSRQRARSGRFKAGALEAACHRMRHLYSPVPAAARPPTETAAAKLPISAENGIGGGAEGLLAQVSRSGEDLQRRQQAEGLFLQRRMDSNGADALGEDSTAPVQSGASVAAGCAGLRKGHNRVQFPPLAAFAEDDSIADQWDDLAARQALETSTMHALRNWLASG